MENNIIKIQKLHKSYGAQKVVNNLCLNIKAGEVFGLLGPNGAGKTTTIRMILGFSKPSSGSITVGDYSSSSQILKVKELVGYLPEEVGFYNQLTGYENLMYTARLNRLARNEAEDRVNNLLRMVKLNDVATKKVGAYSRGMKQRLGLADVLIKKPKIVILDEPTLGLDPKGMKELLSQISDLSKNEGLTVLFSSHHLQQVQHICDRVGLFVKGELIACGDIQSLSDGLFAKSAIVINAKINEPVNTLSKKDSFTALLNEIEKNKHVNGVKINNNLLTVECNKDISAEVAKLVVMNKYDLTYLNKKEYGLEDIYYKYFVGGEYHDN